MRRLAVLAAGVLAALAVPAIVLFRRSQNVPTLGTWAEYEAADQEGDALEPDVYLLALLAGGQEQKPEPFRPADWMWD